jgi:hypothetical protein
MGYEYGFVFTTPLDSLQLADLLHDLQTVHAWLLLPIIPSASRYVLRYAYTASGPVSWDEDFLVHVSAHELYVLLHTVTPNQEAAVLAWLQERAATLGLTGILAEL